MGLGKILLADDEFEIRDFFESYLDEKGFDVTAAEDGQEAWEIYQKNPNFDLVISDMMMPRMIGLELLRQIKSLKESQIVILLTGVKEESMMEKAKKAGCLHYITKPLSLDQIDEKIKEVFPNIPD